MECKITQVLTYALCVNKQILHISSNVISLKDHIFSSGIGKRNDRDGNNALIQYRLTCTKRKLSPSVYPRRLRTFCIPQETAHLFALVIEAVELSTTNHGTGESTMMTQIHKETKCRKMGRSPQISPTGKKYQNQNNGRPGNQKSKRVPHIK